MALSVEAWCLRELRAREARALAWKSLILLAAALVLALLLYLWTETDPHDPSRYHDPDHKTLYETLDGR